MNLEAVTYTWWGTSAGSIGEVAQDIAVVKVDTAQGTLEVGMAQGTSEL